jgi:hypothetical protein
MQFENRGSITKHNSTAATSTSEGKASTTGAESASSGEEATSNRNEDEDEAEAKSESAQCHSKVVLSPTGCPYPRYTMLESNKSGGKGLEVRSHHRL